MSSALSITAAVNPPRAVFLDFPLGHTAGRANDIAGQRRIMIDTLSALDTIQVPGTIRTLNYQWAETDDWKDSVMRPEPGREHSDNRTERDDRPQYQLEADRTAVADERHCPGCYFPE
jgi:hypothetical protein